MATEGKEVEMPVKKTPWIVQKLIRKTPTPMKFMRSTLVFYAGMSLNIYLGVQMFMEGKTIPFVNIVVSLLLPGPFTSVARYNVLGYMKASAFTKWKEVILVCTNLAPAVDTLRYFRGKPPMWFIRFMETTTRLAAGTLPATAAKIVDILEDTQTPLDSYSRIILLASTAGALVSMPFAVGLSHYVEQPHVPTAKYQYWDLSKSESFDVVMTFLLDWTQVTYRVIFFSLLFAFNGVIAVILLVVCSGAVCNLMHERVFRLMHGHQGWLFVLAGWGSATMQFLIFDLCWLEPLPPYVDYVRVVYPFRMVQAAAVLLAILSNWEARAPDMNQPFLMFFCIYGLTNFFIYAVAYPYFTIVVHGQRKANSFHQAEEFIQKLTGINKPDPESVVSV